jgi:hypothetical protein
VAARVPRVWNAAIELGFVLLAAIAGALRTPLWALPALAAAMIAYWGFNRRVGLSRLAEMGGGRLIAAAFVSIALIGAVLGAAYWIGALLSGRTE